MTARAACNKISPTFLVHDGLGHDRARRIASTQEQNVVGLLHSRRSLSLIENSTQLQHVGPQQASFAFGFTARMKALRNFPSTCGASASTSIPCPARNTRASSAR